MTTNFITPPDIVEDSQHTILLIDVDPVDVETLAHLCANHDEPFNVYLYKADMNDEQWMGDVAYRADAIIVNTIENELSPVKDSLVDLLKTFHYGPKNFLNNSRKLNNIYEYFVNRANERKSDTTNPL